MNLLQRFFGLPIRKKLSVTRELWIGFFCAISSMALFSFFALQYWPGDAHHCAVIWDANGATATPINPHLCFCESFDVAKVQAGVPGVRQFSNTWSNLVPLITGLVLALVSGFDRVNQRLQHSNHEATWGGHYPLFFGLIVGFMGPGSMFFHASLTEWGGYLDNLSMLLFVWFLLVYGVFIRRVSAPHQGLYTAFLVVFSTGVGLSMATLMTTDLYVSGWGSLLLWPAALFGVVEVLAMFKGGARTLWFWSAVISTIAALAIWGTSRTLGQELCLGTAGVFGPNSLVQAHGIWHVMANLIAVFLFLHFRGTDTPAL